MTTLHDALTALALWALLIPYLVFHRLREVEGTQLLSPLPIRIRSRTNDAA
jgi:hypothetical protein